MKEPCPYCGRLVGLVKPPTVPGQRQFPPKLHVHKTPNGGPCVDGSGHVVPFRVGAD